jgi:sn-glycerol 3-phosphate transport system ATP-binding protein
MAEVALIEVTKEFPGGAVAVDDLTITADDGEFLILVGPSGCGKTTALRMVAGLEEPTSGVIAIGDRIVTGVSPRDRDIAMVFQNYALYPHMTVYKNLAFGLKERKLPKTEIDRRVKEVTAMLDLDELMDRKPAQLSGGQRQRVAMGRALVREPKAFLLDEPLSNLDAKLRVQVRAQLKRLHRRLGVTTIYVTHDQVEAMTLGDRIAVMSGGVLQQLGAPQEVYDEPANLFVAGFIGSPPMNLLHGSASSGRVEAGGCIIERAGIPDGDVVIGLRPEHLGPSVDGLPSIDFQVDVVEPLGDEVLVYGTVPGRAASVAPARGEQVLSSLSGSRAEITAKLRPKDRPRIGEVLPLGVDPRTVHFFDARTGAAIR